MADPAARDPALAGVFRRPFAEQAAFFRGKLGQLVPTARWTDMRREAHDRGFMVAGAQSADLLAGLAASVNRAVSEGTSLDAFRKDFAALVKRHGWDYRGETNWRTRTIYRTNLSTSYAAGRLAQLRGAGFPFWMYKHGGSAEPRAQHLAWNGLVLPSDHAFWITHYPPNDWGCSCRVIGLRDRDDAVRYGGDPGKALPDGWDEPDPASGEPVGIGEGWGYQPGNTVSESVATMAAKTVQWEYALAKAYMQGVPDRTRDALAAAYRALPSVANDTRLYALRVIEGKGVAPYRTLGLLTAADVERVGTIAQRSVDGFDYALDGSSVRHVFAKHGGASEAARGQRPVEAADFARLPAMINQPDSIDDAGKSDVGHTVVRVSKRFGDEVYIAAFEVRAGRKMLALQSLWIRSS